MQTSLFNQLVAGAISGLLLISIFACEQKEIIKQQPTVAPVTQQISTLTDTEFTSVLDTLDAAFTQLSRISILSDIGIVKNDLTGNYEVNTVVFEEALQDDSTFDLFLSDVDDLVESTTEHEWIDTYIGTNISPDLTIEEEGEIDSRGRKPYCCLICCQGWSYDYLMLPKYRQTKMRRPVGQDSGVGFI